MPAGRPSSMSRTKKSPLASIVLLVFAFMLFGQLHWMQRFEHATVTINGPCLLPDSAPQAVGNDTCLYQDVTLNTSFFTRQYVLELSNGVELLLPRDRVVSYATFDNQRPFTWRTAAASAAMLLCLTLAVVV